MMTTRLTTAVLLILCGARGVVAQEGAVSFVFNGTSVDVQLKTGGAPGQVEVVDADPAAISVIDFTGIGGASFELTEGVLSITHGTGYPGDYRIVVPRRARVSLSVDGRRIASVAPTGSERRLAWSWPGTGVSSGRVFPPALTAKRTTVAFKVNAFFGDLVADSVDLAYTPRIKAFRVVVGGPEFRVTGDRSVSFSYNEEARWGVVVPRAEGATLTVELPTEVRRFKVKVGGSTIWEYDLGRGKTYCDPVAEIIRRDGRKSWVFTPEDGRLECTVTRPPQPA